MSESVREAIRCPDCGRKLGERLPDGLVLMRHADGSALGAMQALGCTRRCGGIAATPVWPTDPETQVLVLGHGGT